MAWITEPVHGRTHHEADVICQFETEYVDVEDAFAATVDKIVEDVPLTELGRHIASVDSCTAIDEDDLLEAIDFEVTFLHELLFRHTPELLSALVEDELDDPPDGIRGPVVMEQRLLSPYVFCVLRVPRLVDLLILGIVFENVANVDRRGRREIMPFIHIPQFLALPLVLAVHDDRHCDWRHGCFEIVENRLHRNCKDA